MSAMRRESYCSLKQTMDDRIMRCGIVGSCQSAVTSRIASASGQMSDQRIGSVTPNSGFHRHLSETRKLCCRKDDRAMRHIHWALNFRDSLTTPTATIPNIFHGLLFRSTL